MSEPLASLGQAMDQAREIAALRAEVAALCIAHDRADGALADAETVLTGDIERGIRLLTLERDGLKAEVKRLTDQGERLSKGLARMQKMAADATANVRALAEALTALMAWSLELDDPRMRYIVVQVDRVDVDAARAALDRSGVVGGREERTR